MSRFSNLQSFGDTQAGGVIAQSSALEKTNSMAGYGAPPNIPPPSFPGFDPYGGAGNVVGYGTQPSVPPPTFPSATDPYAGAGQDPFAMTGGGPAGFMPPGAPPSTGRTPPLLPGGGADMSGFELPPPGSNADPYAMSSFAPGMSLPSPDYSGQNGAYPPLPSPSSAFTDPYAPGGALASPTLSGGGGGASTGSNTGYGRGAPMGRAAGRPSTMNLNRFGHRPIPFPPKELPKWFKWAAGGVMLIILIALFMHWFRGRGSSDAPPPQHATAAPTAPEPLACPPVASCPPTSDGGRPPPGRTEEITLRLAKDDPPLLVKIQDDRRENDRRADNCDDTSRQRERRDDREENDEGKGPKRRSENEERGAQPPVIIVNEARPSTQQPVPMPPDLWEMTYAADAGGGGGPRMSDTNMVYTRVGGPL